jgi:multiple sugar transport system substrate-binding protein
MIEFVRQHGHRTYSGEGFKVKRPLLILFLITLMVAVALGAATKVKFWHMYLSGPSKEIMDEIIAQFNETHKGSIEVEDLAISFWDYWDKIRVAMAAKQEPDVFLHDLGNVGMRASTGILLDLKPYLVAAGFEPDEIFFEGPLEMCSYRGGIYALPLETDVRLLFYNKGLFRQAGLDPDKPPTSWEELLSFAEKLNVLDKNGEYEIVGFNPLYGQSYFWMYVWGKGEDFITEDGKVVVNSPGIVQALQEWVALINKLGLEKLLAFGANFGWGAADAFIAGKVGMGIQVGNFITDLATYAPDLDYGIVQIPYPVQNATWSNGFSLELSSRSRNKIEAVEFALYLLSDEVQLKLAHGLSSLIGNKKAAYKSDLLEDSRWKMQIDALEFTKFRPFVLEAPLWYETLQVATEEAIYGKKTPEQALNDAQKLIEAEIQKYKMTH